MKLVQILLPRYAPNGRAFPKAAYERERELLTERFGGMAKRAKMADHRIMLEHMAETWDRIATTLHTNGG